MTTPDLPASSLQRFPDTVGRDHASALNDPDRLSALASTGLMDSLPEDVFDRASRLASRLLGVPISLLSLVDARRQFFKSATGLDQSLTQTSLSHSFCQYVISQDSALAVDDAREHPLLHSNGAVGDLNVIAYLGVPVHAPDGSVLGSFCAIDTRPHHWTDQQLTDLRDLAAIVETEIALRHSLDERQLLIDELNHRVKNLFSVVTGIVRMSQSQGESPTDLHQRLLSLSRAHDLIAPAIHADRPAEQSTELATLLHTLLMPHASGPERISLAGPEQALGPKASTALTLALHELTTNAAKYGVLSYRAPQGLLQVSWHVDGDDLIVDWIERNLPDLSADADTSVPRAHGFGSKLLAMTVSAQLAGRIETTRDATSLRHRLTLPLDTLAR